MIIGLEHFRDHFAPYINQYVLIGGTACALVLEDVGLEFRATKDLDVVLYIEVISTEFISVFKDFTRKGGYKTKQQSIDKEVFFRFHSPSDPQYPSQIELFSRLDTSKIDFGNQIQRIQMNDVDTSLSAILLNDDYYHFIHEGKIQIKGLSCVNASHLIPLKARACLDMISRKSQGIQVDSRAIRKHRNDVVRLYKLLSLENHILLPIDIKEDMKQFVNLLKYDELDLNNLGLKNTSLKKLINDLIQIYHLN